MVPIYFTVLKDFGNNKVTKEQYCDFARLYFTFK